MDNIRALLVYGLLLSAVASPRALCAEYSLMPSPATVHIGNFNAALKPVLTINSGDIVTIETAATTIESEAIDQSGVVPPSAVPDYTRAILRDVKDRGPGRHILTGPIAVSGAVPGDVLEVRILAIDLAVDYGFNRSAPTRERCPTNSQNISSASLPSTARRARPRSRPAS